MKKELQNAREDYQRHSLLESEVSEDAIEQFKSWLEEYRKKSDAEFNAMTLSTVGVDNKPSARVVLLKGIDQGGFEFYTNYESHKAREMEQNPNVALTFYWPECERQVRVEGKVKKLSAEESEEYFNSRPYGSQIGAWASPQSRPISRDDLQKRKTEYEEKYDKSVPRPDHWGGYRVIPRVIEFWQGRQNRLHDRLIYLRTSQGWRIERLAP